MRSKTRPKKATKKTRTPRLTTPQEFLEGLYDLPRGEAMPQGIYGWITRFGTVVEETLPGDWKGRPWHGGDPCAVGPFGVTPLDRQNCYVCISAFKCEADGHMGRRKHLAVATFAVMIDDIGTKVSRERGLVLPPSYLVETSPGNFQSWLFLEPEEDTERVALTLTAMVRSGLSIDGTDPGMKGITRYGRMPFGHNNKRKYNPPFPVRLDTWQPERRYPLDAIIEAYGLTLEKSRPKFAPPSPERMAAFDRQFVALLKGLALLGLYRRDKNHGWHEISCPWVGEHSDGRDDGAAISEPSEMNNWRGGYRCHHGHCERRGLADVQALVSEAVFDMASRAAKATRAQHQPVKKTLTIGAKDGAR